MLERMVDTLFEVAQFSRLLRCSRLPGVVDVQSAGGEVVDTKPTQEGRVIKTV
jgi:hypothetical protein